MGGCKIYMGRLFMSESLCISAVRACIRKGGCVRVRVCAGVCAGGCERMDSLTMLYLA